jgi:hypothetical protein
VIQQGVLLGEVLEHNAHADDDAGRDTHEAGQDEEGGIGDSRRGVHGESRGQADAGLAASASGDGVEGNKVGDCNDRDQARDIPQELAVVAGLLLLVATVNRQLASSLPQIVCQT